MIIIWGNSKKYSSDNCFELLADCICLLCFCIIAGQGFSHCKARDFVYLDSICYICIIMFLNLCFKYL